MSTPRELLRSLVALPGEVKLVLLVIMGAIASASGFAAEHFNPAYGRLTAGLEAEKRERIASDERLQRADSLLAHELDSLRTDAVDNSYYLGKLVAARCLDLTPVEQRKLQLPCDLLLTGNPLPPAPTRHLRRTP